MYGSEVGSLVGDEGRLWRKVISVPKHKVRHGAPYQIVPQLGPAHRSDGSRGGKQLVGVVGREVAAYSMSRYIHVVAVVHGKGLKAVAHIIKMYVGNLSIAASFNNKAHIQMSVLFECSGSCCPFPFLGFFLVVETTRGTVGHAYAIHVQPLVL